MNDFDEIIDKAVGSPREEVAYLTEKRLGILAWFLRNAPSLGELYEGSLKMIYGPVFPGRVRFVSHAVREIRNRLPEVISGFRNKPGLQYKSRLDVISRAWNKNGLPMDGSLPQAITETERNLSDSITLPKIVFREIGKLIKEHNDAREKPIDSAKRLFTGTTEEDVALENNLRPVLDQWLDVTEWFVKKAHDSGQADGSVDPRLLQEKFEIFETTLGAILGSFFSTVEDLDEILEEANS
jgi:hypothetical protein